MYPYHGVPSIVGLNQTPGVVNYVLGWGNIYYSNEVHDNNFSVQLKVNCGIFGWGYVIPIHLLVLDLFVDIYEPYKFLLIILYDCMKPLILLVGCWSRFQIKVVLE